MCIRFLFLSSGVDLLCDPSDGKEREFVDDHDQFSAGLSDSILFILVLLPIYIYIFLGTRGFHKYCNVDSFFLSVLYTTLISGQK